MQTSNPPAFPAMLMCLLLLPATAGCSEIPGAGNGSAETSPAKLLDAALRARGWLSKRESDGSVTLLPPGDDTGAQGVGDSDVAEEKGEDSARHNRVAGDAVVADEDLARKGEVKGEATTPTSMPPDAGLADRLRRQLTTQGWTATRGDDGSTYFLPPQPSIAVPSPSLAEQLQRQLDAQGWVRSRTRDGSVIYRRTPPPSKSIQVSTPAEQLRAELEARGWRAAPAEGGGVYYLPPGDRTPSAPAPRAAAEPPLVRQLRQQLAAHGWVWFRGADGSTVYRAPQAAAVTAPPRANPTAKPSLAEKLRRELEARGWHAVPADDGGVYYLRPGQDAGAARPRPGLPTVQSPDPVQGDTSVSDEPDSGAREANLVPDAAAPSPAASPDVESARPAPETPLSGGSAEPAPRSPDSTGTQAMPSTNAVAAPPHQPQHLSGKLDRSAVNQGRRAVGNGPPRYRVRPMPRRWHPAWQPGSWRQPPGWWQPAPRPNPAVPLAPTAYPYHFPYRRP